MIIGMCGLAGSGKDTSSDFLVKHNTFVKVAFADPLKRICQDVYKFTDYQLWGPSAARNEPDKRYPREHGPWGKDHKCMCCGQVSDDGIAGRTFTVCYLTPRHALQQLGSEWGRNCYPNTWVEYVFSVHDALQEGGHYYDAKSGLRPISRLDAIRSTSSMAPKTNVVISDVRFENEIMAIKKVEGKVFRLLRGQGLVGASGQHRSETEQQGIPDATFDLIIDNREWTLEQLEEFISKTSTNLK